LRQGEGGGARASVVRQLKNIIIYCFPSFERGPREARERTARVPREARARGRHPVGPVFALTNHAAMSCHVHQDTATAFFLVHAAFSIIAFTYYCHGLGKFTTTRLQ